MTAPVTYTLEQREEAAQVLEHIFVGAPDDRANEALLLAVKVLRQAAAEGQGNWHPITTAPKDFTQVLLWWPTWSTNRAIVGAWNGRHWQSPMITVLGLETWPEPTHWQPMPTEPFAATPTEPTPPPGCTGPFADGKTCPVCGPKGGA